VVTEIKEQLNPGVMVEVLCLYKKPDLFLTEHIDNNFWDDTQRTVIFNQLVAIGTLTGIQYYSASRNIMRTFYEYSGVIDGAQTRNSLPDPFFTQPPETLTLFARQKDLTFGDNVYRYDYTAQDIIFFTQENVTALSIGFIPVIGRGNLRSIMAVIDCGDSLLIYAVSMARAASLPGMGDRISSSLTNRAEALLDWFIARLDNEVFN
jgi:hypothetical protein